MRIRLLVLLLGCYLWANQTLLAQTNAGAWCWASPGEPWGLAEIVGIEEREDAAVREFQHGGMRRVYGAHQTRPATQPDWIRRWNIKLQAAGISSYYLLSENTWIFPPARSNLLALILQPNFLAYQAACSNQAELFTGLHFDIEPHALGEWSTNTPSRKRDLLWLLRDTYAEVRAFLDTHDASDTPIHADLPVWFDNLGGSIGWLSAADRDQWFADIGAMLTGVSLMPFERATFASISNGIAWEITHLPCEVRVGLEADIGSNQTWITFAEMTHMGEQLAAAFGAIAGPDYQSFRQYQQQAPPRAGALEISGISTAGAMVHVHGFFPGRTGLVQAATGLQANAIWATQAVFCTWAASFNLSNQPVDPAALFFRAATD